MVKTIKLIYTYNKMYFQKSSPTFSCLDWGKSIGEKSNTDTNGN